ncbi:hypothetical protein SDC9_146347 [bioreactor metagenome]|uniref:Uncharacterized protein n=1 Tax=bioreactor metagenome TaxID=1076179 RepID=A0A645EBU5_9ZZZZ
MVLIIAINPQPAIIIMNKDAGIQRINAKKIRKMGETTYPIIQTLPRVPFEPMVAIISAPMREPTPRAESSRPLVVTSPLSTSTAQAGNKVKRPKPKKPTMPRLTSSE